MTPTQRIQWLHETDPLLHFGLPISVTDEDVTGAVRVVLMDRIRDGIKRLGSGFQSLVGLNRRTKSLPVVTVGMLLLYYKLVYHY